MILIIDGSLVIASCGLDGRQPGSFQGSASSALGDAVLSKHSLILLIALPRRTRAFSLNHDTRTPDIDGSIWFHRLSQTQHVGRMEHHRV